MKKIFTIVILALTVNAYAQNTHSVLFNDAGSSIRVNDSPSLSPTDITIAFWTKVYSNNDYNHWVNKMHVGVIQYAIASNTTGIYAYFGNSTTTDFNQTTTSPPLNQWCHIAVTYDWTGSSANCKIYLDGVELSSWSTTIQMQNTSDYLEFGGNSVIGAGYNSVDGLMDDISIWNTALTGQNIVDLMNCPPFGNESNLVGYWKFEEGTGLLTNDQTLNSNDGTLLNGTAWSSIVPYVNDCCNLLASISAGSSTTFCQGNSVTLSASQQGNPYTFQWLLNGSTIGGATNYNYTASASGNYSVIVDSLGCIDTSNVISVTVNSLPSVSINAIPAFVNYFATSLTLSGNPIGGTFSGNGMTGNNFNPNTAGLGSHNILYNYTDGNSCSNSATISTIVYDTLGVVCTSYDTVTTYISVTDTLVIDAVLTGISPPNNINTMKIYPNPASTHITIDNGDYLTMSGYTIRIDNNLSQTVFTSPINQATFYVDLSTWSGNGLYFVYIIDNLGNTIEIKKIILQ